MVLECLAILAVLYTENVAGGLHSDWQRFGLAGFSFPQQLGHSDPRELAQRITDNDMDYFLHLRPSDYQLRTEYFRTLERSWNDLADIVKACCLALPDSIEKISKVVVVSCVSPLSSRA